MLKNEIPFFLFFADINFFVFFSDVFVEEEWIFLYKLIHHLLIIFCKKSAFSILVLYDYSWEYIRLYVLLFVVISSIILSLLSIFQFCYSLAFFVFLFIIKLLEKYIFFDVLFIVTLWVPSLIMIFHKLYIFY